MTKVGQDLIQAASGADSIDALIERINKYHWGCPYWTTTEIVDALAKLRDEVRRCDGELVDISNKYQAEIARLKEALEDCVGYMSYTIVGSKQRSAILQEARAALGGDDENR